MKNKFSNKFKKLRQKLGWDDSAPEAAEATDKFAAEKEEIFTKARSYLQPLTPTRQKFIFITGGIVTGLLAGFLAVIGVLIYRYHSSSNLVYQVAQVVPYPVARVNGDFVTYEDYLRELRPLKTLHKNSASQSQQLEADFSTPEGQKQLADLRKRAFVEAKTKAIIRQLADQHQISVSKQEIDSNLDQHIAQVGGRKRLKDTLEEQFGWEITDLRWALRYRLLRDKIQPKISTKQRDKIENIRQKIVNGGNFGKLAKKHSQDPGSKNNGGDLGFTGRGQYVPEFENVAFDLEKGKISQVVETPFGFHIIKKLGEKEQKVHVAHILINYANLEQELQKQLEEAEATNYIKFQNTPNTNTERANSDSTQNSSPVPAQPN